MRASLIIGLLAIVVGFVMLTVGAYFAPTPLSDRWDDWQDVLGDVGTLVLMGGLLSTIFGRAAVRLFNNIRLGEF
jgi:hypothetical protein